LHTKWHVNHNAVWYSSVYLVPPKGTLINNMNYWLIDYFLNNNSEFPIIFKLGNFEQCFSGDDTSQIDKMHLLKMARQLVLN